MSDALEMLRARLEEAIGGRSGALAFEKASGGAFRRTTVQSWIDGKTWPDFAELVEFAKATGKPLAFFLPPNLPEPSSRTVVIPVLNVDAAAGSGQEADVVLPTGELTLPVDFVRRFAAAGAQLSCLRCAGDSMEPTIQHGAMLIVDERRRDLSPWRPPPRKGPRERQKPDDIYVFLQSGDLRLKRLRDLGDDFVFIWGDNHIKHPPEVFRRGRDGALAIIGKVIWWDNRL